jgi:hypothetical protein
MGSTEGCNLIPEYIYLTSDDVSIYCFNYLFNPSNIKEEFANDSMFSIFYCNSVNASSKSIEL